MAQVSGVELLASGRQILIERKRACFVLPLALGNSRASSGGGDVWAGHRCRALKDMQELLDLVPRLNGHLTASVFAGSVDLESCGPLVDALESRVDASSLTTTRPAWRYVMRWCMAAPIRHHRTAGLPRWAPCP